MPKSEENVCENNDEDHCQQQKQQSYCQNPNTLMPINADQITKSTDQLPDQVASIKAESAKAPNRTYLPNLNRNNSSRCNNKYPRSVSAPKGDELTVMDSSRGGVDMPDTVALVLQQGDNSIGIENGMTEKNNLVYGTSPKSIPIGMTNTGKKYSHMDSKSSGSFSTLTRSLSRGFSKESLSSHAQQLASSSGTEFMCLKITFAFIMSTLIGGVLILSLFVGGRISLDACLIIAGSFTVISFCGLVFSKKTRAVYALALPSLCATRGQTIIMSLAFSLILQGPVLAILENMEQVGTSMACHAEMAEISASEIVGQYAEPIYGLENHVKHSIERFKNLTLRFKGPLDTIENRLKTISHNLNMAEAKLRGYKEECKDYFNDLKTKCSDNVIGDVCKTVSRFRRDDFTSDQSYYDTKYTPAQYKNGRLAIMEQMRETTLEPKVRHKRSSNCEWLDDTCNDATGVMSSTFCVPIDNSMELVKKAKKEIQNVSMDVHRHLFGYNITTKYTSNTNVSQPKGAKEMKEQLVEQFQKWKPIVESSSEKMSLLMALFFLTIFLKSYTYITKFVQDVSYDNFYYSSELEERLKQQEAPVKKSELKKLVRIKQWKRTKKENKRIFYSLISSAVYTTIAVSVLFFNAFLYYSLEAIKKYGKTETVITGTNDFDIKVNETGLMSEVISIFSSSFNTVHNISAVDNNEECLPAPVRVENEELVYSSILVLFLIFYFTIVSQTWVLRLRHVICCMFFEGMEEARLDWLTRKLSYQIENRDLIFSKNILRSFHEKITREKFIEFGISEKLQRCCCNFRAYCFACRRTKWGRHTTRVCNEHLADNRQTVFKATFCQKCNKKFNKECIMCKQGVVEFGIDNFAYKDDFSTMSPPTTDTEEKGMNNYGKENVFKFPTSSHA